MSRVPPPGSPRDRGNGGGFSGWSEMSGVPARLYFSLHQILGAFSQCAWLWSPTTFAGLFSSEHQFRGVEPLLWIVAVESCKDSDLSSV
jgi:hypothetical protein